MGLRLAGSDSQCRDHRARSGHVSEAAGAFFLFTLRDFPQKRSDYCNGERHYTRRDAGTREPCEANRALHETQPEGGCRPSADLRIACRGE